MWESEGGDLFLEASSQRREECHLQCGLTPSQVAAPPPPWLSGPWEKGTGFGGHQRRGLCGNAAQSALKVTAGQPSCQQRLSPPPHPGGVRGHWHTYQRHTDGPFQEMIATCLN